MKTSTSFDTDKRPPLNAEAPYFYEHLTHEVLISYSNHIHMKSTANSSDGNFPYGDQPIYRNFLLWEEILKNFAEHAEANITASDPLVVAKYFHPSSSMTWYATEYNPETEIFYGYVTGFHYPEWGTFSLREFIELQLPYGLKIERDLWFTPKPIKEVLKQEGHSD